MRTLIDEGHEWGLGKIKGEVNFSESAITSLHDILNQTEEEPLKLEGSAEEVVIEAD